jgi:hypothetical protein
MLRVGHSIGGSWAVLQILLHYVVQLGLNTGERSLGNWGHATDWAGL